ncbi:hypothetical protein GK047_12470 [Paenibacillus sp. SYP-B3998]|uniref:Uncharacterized protein n=1 Tax=Paenibacillus sp. SYP-B3998 TaxID=2678564 RepID=A0A6G3ZX79_9BACL|nr:hypothetical protein [Paenibacillus sp. SYP-B3998]NEW06826.1 hypothetical protein [Paenibacillus sp. SYP-B3998]
MSIAFENNIIPLNKKVTAASLVAGVCVNKRPEPFGIPSLVRNSRIRSTIGENKLNITCQGYRELTRQPNDGLFRLVDL